MFRRNGTHGWRSVVGPLLIAGLVVAQGLQAATLEACPHHGGAHPPAEAGHGHSDHGASPDAPPPHDAPCDCMGSCQAQSAVETPRPSSESVFVLVAPRPAIRPFDTLLPPKLLTLPFALPYPNAPPA